MKSLLVLPLLLGIASSVAIKRDETASLNADTAGSYCPTAVDTVQNVTYQGIYQYGVEAFLGIHYGQDTSGQNRFKPPRPYTYQPGSVVKAFSNGPACPQPTGAVGFPIYLSNITDTSEDCLLLNVKRPPGTNKKSKYPVMVWIHGGSFIGASKDEIVAQPSGLILQSVQNGSPVIVVALNYRLGSFGFAQSNALQKEGSENAGLRDQRLAIEWTKKNIANFGGDPNQITIFGQSSGGLSVGMQIMAYGASKPVPFQQGICESQALEGGITGNFTRMAMMRLTAATGCNTTALDSAATVACLRNLTTAQMLKAQTDTYLSSPSANLGDEWLPTVDGDFLPEAPSKLIAQGKFANVNAIIGWCDGDADIIAPMTIRTANDTDRFLRGYLPGFNNTSIRTVESLYPVSEFQANPAANLTAEFYRSARIMRDIVFTCMAINYGDAIAAKSPQNQIYFYDQNQTFLNPALTSLDLPNLGVVHTSEMAYVFGNLSHYNVDDFPFKPNATDYALLQRESRSWSSFATTGNPSPAGKSTLQGWGTAYSTQGNNKIYVVGGPQEGLFAWQGGANAALNNEKLPQRCAFWNSPEIIQQLNY